MSDANQILLIEDDRAVAETLQDALSQEGYVVAWKSSGADGLQHLGRNAVHLIILDVRLPDGSGFDFCRQIRQRKYSQPILMLTARREEVDKVLGLEMGADDYMTKPFGLRELVSRVRSLLRRAYGELAGAGARQLLVRDLIIDLERAEVRRGPSLLNLTPMEYRLLSYLARHAGLALSRGQILSEVWGYDAQADNERIVTVTIRRLREKVEPDPSRPTLILTVPGIGYRLEN